MKDEFHGENAATEQSLKVLRSYSFRKCTSLKSIVIPSGVESIESETFADCTSLTKVEIEEGVRSLTGTAFWHCPIESIYLPSTIKSVSSYFAGCDDFVNIYVSEDNSNYTSVDGVLYTKDKKKLVVFPTAKTGSYSVLDGTEIIGHSSFAFSKISNVYFPNTVSTFEYGAFYNSKITDIVIPYNIKEIPKQCFMHAELESITIPKTVTSILDSAFYAFNSKTMDVKYQGSSSDWNSISISSGNSNLTNSNIYYNYIEPNYQAANTSQDLGGTDRFTLSNIDMSQDDILNLSISGDVGDTIQVHFYYTDKNGNASSSLVGGLDGTVLDSNGNKTVSFIAPNDLNSISVKITYNKSLPTYTYDISRKEIVTQPTTTQITTTSTKETTTTTKKTTVITTTKQTTTTSTTTTNTENKSFQVGIDDYSFENYTGKITLSDSSLAVLEKNINNLDWDEVEKYLSGKSTYGHCYGMAAVQILTKMGVLNVADIDSAAKTLYDVSSPKNKKSVDDILNYYVVLQKTRVIQSRLNKYSRKTN